MIAIDLQKAFETLDEYFLDKMRCLGFSDKTIQWFHSHLTELFGFLRQSIFGSRDHKVWSSSRIYIRTFIVLLYINDIPQALSNSHTYLCADDNSIFYQHKDVMEIENVLNQEFGNVCKYMRMVC